jgi:hypothetical protein
VTRALVAPVSAVRRTATTPGSPGWGAPPSTSERIHAASSGPLVKHGTITSAGAEGVVVTGKENGLDARRTFIVDSKTAIRKSGKDVTVADLNTGDSVVVYFAPESTVAQLISVLAVTTEAEPAEPAPIREKR